MRIFITGEKGFIGRNLVKKLPEFGFSHITSDDVIKLKEFHTDGKEYTYHKPGELCVHQNTIAQWLEFFFRTKTEVIIHNAASVGTDVVALNPNDSTLTNVAGTYNICRAAKMLGIPVCYMGTTVIYDVAKYQKSEITESSLKRPTTLYGCHKLCAEDIVKTQTGKRWMIVRPLFAYGGEGDMNSLIAKTSFGYINGKTGIDMFLDQDKVKDYMHVDDYCDAVLTAISRGMWNDDWNVSAETPLSTGEIMLMLERILVEECGGTGIEDVLTWHPKTDYLGNHRLSSSKFRRYAGWEPKISLEAGIRRTVREIKESEDYDPLVHLDEAKEKGVDLTNFY